MRKRNKLFMLVAFFAALPSMNLFVYAEENKKLSEMTR